MSYYLEPNNHIRDKVKEVLNFPNYATKKMILQVLVHLI